jgi:hypothetical protein
MSSDRQIVKSFDVCLWHQSPDLPRNGLVEPVQKARVQERDQDLEIDCLADGVPDVNVIKPQKSLVIVGADQGVACLSHEQFGFE